MGTNPFLPDTVEQYINSTLTRETGAQKALREATALLPQAIMQITPEQGALLGLLVKITGARNILEIGSFTGYSALAMALALPADGTLVACDTSRDWTQMAQHYWQEAGVRDKIELRIGKAMDTLHALEKEKTPFDLIFIDADKKGYDGYYEACLPLLEQGGIIIFDNMLWGGAVADAADTDNRTLALRALNLKLHQDERVDTAFIAISDGMMVVRKR